MSLKDSLQAAIRNQVPVEAAPSVQAATDDYVTPPEWKVLEAAWAGRMTLLLTGPPGCGKTEIARRFAESKQVPFMRKPVEADTEASEFSFTRQVIYDDGKPAVGYTLSSVLEFIQHEGILLIDEPFQSTSGALAPFRTILDEGRVYIPDGRVIDKNPKCQVLFADNTKGGGESFEKYQRNIQDASLLSRVEAVVEFDYLPPEKEVPLIMNLMGCSSELAAKLQKLADLTRKAYAAGELSRVITLRQFKAAGRFTGNAGIRARMAQVFRTTLSSDSQKQAYDTFFTTVGL